MIFDKAASTTIGYSGRTAARLPVLLILFSILTVACKVAATAHVADTPGKNAAAVKTARDNIERFRKGRARIRVLDKQGRPAVNTRLNIRQISHAFKFGCYLKIDDLDAAKLPDYERRFKELFNYAVVGNYWDNVENKPGAANWSWFDRETAMAERLGLGIAGAPVLWGTYKFGTPGWLPANKSELLPQLERRVRSSVTRNASVTEWEVVNEPLAPKSDFFAAQAGAEYIASAFAWARDAAPAKRLMINEYGVFGSSERNNYNRQRYYDLLENLTVKGVPIDVIGIQAHANGEWFGPANVADQLDRYARLGKPLQITEFSVQTLGNKGQSPLAITGGYRSGIWDAQSQAEFYREFYTIAFGSQSVEAIVTWGLDDERAWLPGIGLVDADGKPKPAFLELDRLINGEWKTRLEGTTGRDGVYDLTGFFGDYEISAAAGGTSTASKFTLRKGDTNEWVIRLGQ
jgi:endo-1,4-beta-xylanase